MNDIEQDHSTECDPPAQRDSFSDEELLRYSRHIMLPQIDIDGQLAIARARILILGLGGLGSATSLYLAASGIGHLVLLDDDAVDLSNLQRQVVHNEESIGVNKAASAARTLRRLNPQVSLTLIQERLSAEALAHQVGEVDAVCDCSDNFPTRRLLNEACVAQGKPLISGAAIRFEAQMSVFDPRDEKSPCYQCLYPVLRDEDLTCSQSGVLSPMVGVVGSMQALEALKVIGNFGSPLIGRLLLFDALQASWRELKITRDPNCPVCSAR